MTGLSGCVSSTASAGPISVGAPSVLRENSVVVQVSPPPVARTRQYSWVCVGSWIFGTYWRCTVVTLTRVVLNWSDVEIWKSYVVAPVTRSHENVGMPVWAPLGDGLAEQVERERLRARVGQTVLSP